MAFRNMVTMQLMMFLLVGIGFFVRKKEIIGETARKELVNFCLYITLPFNIFHSFLMKTSGNMLMEFAVILLLSVGYNVISIAIGYLCYRKTPAERQKPLRYGTIVSNGGFLGNPVIEGIYGAEGLLYASVFMLPVRIVMWSIGPYIFMKDIEDGGKGQLFKKVITHPCVAAIYMGLIVMAAEIELPAFISKTVSGISSCNTPLSMMLVGMMLAEMQPKGIMDKTMVFYNVMRLGIIPGVIFLATVFLPVPAMLRGITVIIAGMPAPITTALMSAKYKQNETYATGMIFVSTILSLITLPLWCLVLGYGA